MLCRIFSIDRTVANVAIDPLMEVTSLWTYLDDSAERRQLREHRLRSPARPTSDCKLPCCRRRQNVILTSIPQEYHQDPRERFGVTCCLLPGALGGSARAWGVGSDQGWLHRPAQLSVVVL